MVLNGPPTGPSITTGGLLQDDVITSQTPVTFSWALVSSLDAGVYSYQLQLATDSKFTQLLVNSAHASNATTRGPLDPLPPGTYYWRVRSIYMPSGLASAYSVPYRFIVVDHSTAMPVLTAPLADSTLSTSRPTFQWKSVPLSAGYRVRIIQNPTGNNPSPYGPDIELTKTTYTPTANLPQGEYAFLVESKDAQGDWSGFAEQRRFVVNYGLSPADQGVVVVNASPTGLVMKWSKLKIVNPANTIRIQFDHDPDFSSPITSPILPASATTYTFPPRPSGIYYWRVLVTGHPTYPTSLTQRFTISPPLPVAPLIENAIPAFTNDPTPRFDWQVPANWATLPPGGSLSYQLEIATDKKFTQLVNGTVAIPAPDTHYDLPTELTPGLPYYWRVRAITNLNVAGAYSKVSSFTLDMTAPTQPTLKAPADGFVSTSSRPTFAWNPGTNGAVLYRLEIYDDPTLTAPPVYSVNTSRTTFPQSLPQGVHYWRVHGLDKAGNGGDVAVPARSITIDSRITPAEGSIVEAPTAAGVPVVFKWLAATGVPAGMTYTIEIDTNLDGSTDTALVPVTTLTATSAALPPGYYRYRLVVSNGGGTSGWRAFVVVPQ